MSTTFFQDMKAMRKAWLLFLPWMLFYAASYFQRTAIPGTTFGIFQSEFGYTAAQIAGLTAAFVYIYSPFQVVIGMLVDKFGGMRTVTVGGAILCTGVLGFPLSCGNLILMYFFRFLTGMGASFLYLSLVKETDRVFGRKNYAVMLGIVYFIGYGGGLCGTLPFELVCRHFNWNNALILIGLISFALYMMFLFAKRFVPQPPIKEKKLSLAPVWQICKNPLTWPIVYCCAVNFACNSITQMVFGKKFLEDAAGMNSTTAATMIFVQTFVCMLALLSGGIQTRLTGNRRKPLMILSSALVLANTLMMYFTVRYQLPGGFFVAGLIVYALGSGFSIAYPLACQEVNSRDNNALSAGFCNFASYLAIALASPLIGMLLDSYVDTADRVAGQVVTYPMEAYEMLYLLTLIPVSLSLLLSFIIPETKGHFLHQHAPDSKEPYRHFLQANRR